MECPSCQSKIDEMANYCWQCGFNLKSKRQEDRGHGSSATAGDRISSGTGGLRSPSGLWRTLSTEFVARENNITILDKINSMVDSMDYGQGDIILKKGEINRDLYFLTEGVVKVSSRDNNGSIVLSTLPTPNIFGDIGFRFGLPRTADVEAMTPVKVYILRYETMKKELGEYHAEWIDPLLIAFVSGIKALNDEIRRLTKKIESGMEKNENKTV